VDVLVSVDAGADADESETAELAARLQAELVAHDLDPVVPATTAPAGTKGIGTGDLGSLLVVLAASGGVLTTLVGMLQAWLLRQSGSRLLLEVGGDRIELTGTSDEERRRALDLWLARHEADRKTEARGGGGTAA